MTDQLTPPVRPRFTTREIEAYPNRGDPVEIELDANESPFVPPGEWRRILIEEIGKMPVNRYPEGSGRRLRTAIAELHGLSPENVFIGNGSNDVLRDIFLAFGGPGRTAVVYPPTYGGYERIATLTGTGCLDGRRDEHGRADPAAPELLGADLAVVCSPNNPTGASEPFDGVREICEALPGLAIIDEAYAEFAPRSLHGLVAEDARFLVIRTLSKAWSLAGLRVGYCLGPGWVVAELKRIALPYNFDRMKEAAALAALRCREDLLRHVSVIVAERERLTAKLGALGLEAARSEANFILVKTRPEEADVLCDRLLARSIAVRRCSATWPELRDRIRITVGTREENDALLEALATELRQLRRPPSSA